MTHLPEVNSYVTTISVFAMVFYVMVGVFAEVGDRRADDF